MAESTGSGSKSEQIPNIFFDVPAGLHARESMKASASALASTFKKCFREGWSRGTVMRDRDDALEPTRSE